MAPSAKRRNSPARDPKWRLVERVVAVLEKSLTPDAQVLHDHKLPILTGASGRRRKRQFDVVIKSGKPPRETLTVVEVQDRSRAVGEDQLVAWHRKMQQVGAQHLICVSKKGFRSTAKEFALSVGPTVRLVTLKELDAGVGPLQTVLGSFDIIEYLTGPVNLECAIILDDVVREALADGKTEALIRIEFRLDKKLAALHQTGRPSPISLNQLIDERRAEVLRTYALGEGVQNVKLVSSADGVFEYVDGGIKHRLTLDITDTIAVKKAQVPITCLSYQQEQVDGSLAWIMKASCKLHDQDVDLRLTFVPDSEGNLVIRPLVFGLPPSVTINGQFQILSTSGQLKFQHELQPTNG